MALTRALEINSLSVQFGGLKAVSNLSLTVKHGELVGLIGPNGAGKTTVFNALTGFCHVNSGSISFDGNDITHRPPHFVARYGVARTFQNIRLFKDLSVLDNLKIAYHQNFRYSMLGGVLRTSSYHQQEAKVIQEAQQILDLVNLGEYRQVKAGNLAYGNQRKLEVARALVMKPKLLLLDEPAAGMNPFETRELVELIRQIQTNFDLTVFLIEHDMSLVMNLCRQIYVLDYGLLIASGGVDEVRNDPRVIEAYLGEDAPWQS